MPVEEKPVFGPYTLCGWRVESSIALPELLPWHSRDLQQPAEAPVRLVLSRDEAPAIAPGTHFQVEPDGSFTLRISIGTIFQVNPPADTVSLWSTDDMDRLLLRAHFYGSILAVLCYRRGLLPIHASAVRVGEDAVMFSGDSGTGKSTLATALAHRGHALLCDDVCAIDLANPIEPVIRPAFPRVKLMEDAMDLFGMGRETLYSEAARGSKGHFGIVTLHRDASAAIPVAAVYTLTPPQPGLPNSTERMAGSAAFLFLRAQVHRAAMGMALGYAEQLFRQTLQLASAVPVYAFSRTAGLPRIAECVDLLERAHGVADSSAGTATWQGLHA